MSDYNFYNFSIKESNLLKVLNDARDAGYNPMIIINGMYYTIEFDNKTKKPD